MFRSLGPLFFVVFGFLGLAHAEPFQTTANRALLFDDTSGIVLFEKNAQSSVGLAATTKIMVAVAVVEALRNGEISLSDEFAVSEDAWRRGGGPSGGPSMFANLHSKIAIMDLLRGLMVQGGNDACLVLAEGIAGSEQGFVERMNSLASKIGLNQTHFTNVTGKADDAQNTTLRDTFRLAQYFQKSYPEWYKIYSEREFTWNGIRQLNRNPLIASFAGTDGLAVASSDAGSFDLVGSAKRDNRHFIVVIEARSAKERNEEAERLLDWAFTSFTSVAAFKAGAIVGEVRVFGGTESHVPVVAANANSRHSAKGKSAAS